MKLKRVLGFGVACAVSIVAYTQLTLFVVQPIGALPDGVTAVLWRRSAVLNFIDSADGVCDRTQHGVSLLCRGITIATVVKVNPILLRLPYIDVLYEIST